MELCPHCNVGYNDCECCCAVECPYLDHEDPPGGPCEGPVEVVDEEYYGDENDYYWIHRCKKHAKNYLDGF